jgi:hypothetical protein
MSTAETLDIDVEVKRITEKAYLAVISRPGSKPLETWIPKSQVKETDCLAPGDSGTMTITYWIAKEKGLVEEEDE